MAICTHTDQITILEPPGEAWSWRVIDELTFRIRPEPQP
jgi:hypothetical protein